MSITLQLVNEIKTLDDYRQACLAVQQRIQAGHEIEWTVLHSLAVKGHLLALANASDEERVTMVTEAFLATERAEPVVWHGCISGTMGQSST